MENFAPLPTTLNLALPPRMVFLQTYSLYSHKTAASLPLLLVATTKHSRNEPRYYAPTK